MLTLKRRVGESIVIGKDSEIEIILMNSRDGIATIGIVADKAKVPIYRSELTTNQRENITGGTHD
jgi:carbon storage regulator CsrA|tara:strand:+ start:551 stop:745 length:195 start_codon:yes stop_codon:yes gene_type:complete